MLHHTLTKLSLLAVLCLTVAGCNVFEGFAEEADTAEELIDEADVLLAKGDAVAAEKALENALAKDPTNKEVKVKLAVTKIEANNISVSNLLELMNELEDLSSGTGSIAAPLAPVSDGRTCLPGEAHDRGSNFDPLSINIFQEFQSKMPIYNRINELLGEVLPTITASTTRQQIIDAIEDAGISEEQSGQYAQAALLASALSDLSTSIVSTFSINGVTYKKITKGDNSGVYYGFCATDDAIADLCDTLTGTGGTFSIAQRAINALSVRAGGQDANNDDKSIVFQAQAALDSIEDEVVDACPSSSGS